MVQTLTHRDEEILDTLSCRVRILALRQVTDGWWNGNLTTSARSRLRVLERRGWIDAYTVMVHPFLPIKTPVFTWSPGKSFPPYRSLSYQITRRWNQDPVRMNVFVASAKAARSYGGRGGRLPRNSELSHDIHLAQVFLTKWKEEGMDPELWQSEELFHTQDRHIKRPDAFIRPNKAIEMGGQYGPDKLKIFHALCEENGWEYEIW